MADPTTVLVIDDEPGIRQLLKIALTQKEWTVETAEDAEQALELCKNRSFDCYIVDKNLPGISGIGFIGTMRGRGDDGCFIIITAFASPETAVEALHLDVDAYVEKPFEDIIEATNRIERLVEARRRRRQPGSLAAALDHFERAAQSLKRISTQKSADRRLRILLACLTDADRQVATEALGAKDVISTVSTPEEAITHVRKQKPDLLVVDGSAEETELTELLVALDEQGVGAESVVLCSRASLESVTQWIDLGVKALLEKPLHAEPFNARVGAVLRRLRRLTPKGA